jgi:hypothetical protein
MDRIEMVRYRQMENGRRAYDIQMDLLFYHDLSRYGENDW